MDLQFLEHLKKTENALDQTLRSYVNQLILILILLIAIFFKSFIVDIKIK